MIELFVFHVHAMAGLYAFTKRWQEGKLREGLMAIAIFFFGVHHHVDFDRANHQGTHAS